MVDTRRLFLKLLRTFEIDTVCDVGSLNGSDALKFRRVLPTAEIIALEPNPRNFALMETDERLRRRGIRIRPLAASDRDAEAPFFVVPAEYTDKTEFGRRGMSSLHRRSRAQLAEVINVRTVRIDTLVESLGRTNATIALWIDAEGMAFEAIAGAAGVLGRTAMLHVEVETVPLIGASQKLLPDVERLLLDAGFALLAMDGPRTSLQLNVLFVRAELLSAKAEEIRRHVENGQLRDRVKRLVRPLVPLRLRRYVAHRREFGSG